LLITGISHIVSKFVVHRLGLTAFVLLVFTGVSFSSGTLVMFPIGVMLWYNPSIFISSIFLSLIVSKLLVLGILVSGVRGMFWVLSFLIPFNSSSLSHSNINVSIGLGFICGGIGVLLSVFICFLGVVVTSWSLFRLFVPITGVHSQ
jgi:hypothetical protein